MLLMSEMLHKKSLWAIINPISGTRSKENLPDLVKEILRDSQYEIVICITEYAGHATQLAYQAVAQRVDVVLALGGDGTCNEIAKALVHSSVALGIIPLGSGNGLARHISMPMNPRKALEMICSAVMVEVDYGMIGANMFFCTCGVGFDAAVSKSFSEQKKRGWFSYLSVIVRKLFRYKSEVYTFIIDGNITTQKAFLIACANTSQYGNNAMIAPNASMQDGWMDVVIVNPFHWWETGFLTEQVFTGRLDKNPRVKVVRYQELTIIRPHSGNVHVDGEPIKMGKELHVKIIHKGIRLLIPITI